MAASPFELPENDRSSLIIMTKVAEQCERYDEMLVCMKRVVKLAPHVLSLEEKNLLSVAYKNVVGSRRAPWRTLAVLEQRADRQGHADVIRSFKVRLEAEIGDICSDIFDLLDNFLIPHAGDDESYVFYYKMKGDYHRYYVEVNAATQHTDAAQEAYAKATTYAENLKHSSPIRLGLALNFSVFHYEILKQPEAGYRMAKAAFSAALPDLERLEDDDYREAATIMTLLRDNLNTWSEALNITDDKAPDDGTAMEDC